MGSSWIQDAQAWLDSSSLDQPEEGKLWHLQGAMQRLIWHLEAQQETPASASQPTEQPVPSSSEATRTVAATPFTLPISLGWSSRVRADGKLSSSVVLDIAAYCNSLRILGGEQEVEIGVTLTSKASTPLAGSASPSTVEPTREGNGAAGDLAGDIIGVEVVDGLGDRVLRNPCICWDGKGPKYSLPPPASSPEPAQGGSEAAARMLNLLSFPLGGSKGGDGWAAAHTWIGCYSSEGPDARTRIATVKDFLATLAGPLALTNHEGRK